MSMKCLHPIVLRNHYYYPCRKCYNCRIARTNDWSIRLEDESIYHENIIFITLTYNNESLPSPPQVSKRTATLFIKKLRKWISTNCNKTKIKYFLCGEYGEQGDRPHYHAIIFGWKPDDLLLFKVKNGNILYTSETLTKIWSYGFTTIANSSSETIRYCLKYLQKINKPLVHSLEPNFSIMSNSLGLQFIQENYQDIIKEESIRTKYGKNSIPRYYIKWIHENIDPTFLVSEKYYNEKSVLKSQLAKKKKEKYERKHKRTIYESTFESRYRRALINERINENPILK